MRGIDLAPVQPTEVPVNLEFQIDDFNSNWTWKPNSIDYIHVRMMAGHVRNWEIFFKQCYSILKPGGYLEVHDVQLPVETALKVKPNDWVWHRWSQVFVDAGRMSGKPFNTTYSWRALAEQAGFRDPKMEQFKLPIGGWEMDPCLKARGRLYSDFLLEALDGLTGYLTAQVLGWTREQHQLFAVEVRQALRAPWEHQAYVY